MKNIAVTNNPPSSPFTKGGIISPPSNKGRLRRERSAERLRGIFLLTNPKGISVLFLVIAMMLMVTIGYVFSYLIPTKQKTSSFPIHSIKAFYLAQSGIEFAVRYSINTWGANATPAELNGLDTLSRNLGDRGGYFILDYDRPNNTLISKGIIPNGSERWVKVSNFTSFLRNPMGVILDPRAPAPCWSLGTRRVRFSIRNATENTITFTSFYASWDGAGTLTDVYMGGVQKYYNAPPGLSSPTGRTNFNRGGNSQDILSDQAMLVDIYWDANITGNIVIRFYYFAAGWNYYIFYLTPDGGGLGSC